MGNFARHCFGGSLRLANDDAQDDFDDDFFLVILMKVFLVIFMIMMKLYFDNDLDLIETFV